MFCFYPTTLQESLTSISVTVFVIHKFAADGYPISREHKGLLLKCLHVSMRQSSC